ncbi:MAG: glycosyltransferase family 39 protein, partial [Patescibacteria group bacterium]|nr:glycosyltransferase family 39 protein [Patescibacteria group bacterium]
MMIKIIKNQFFWLALIIILAFTVRLYKIDNPIADWHSWRQADTAAVARNFYKDGFAPFTPRYDDISGVAENPVPNPGRYRFVEFPIYNSLVYFAYLLNGGVNEMLARLVSVLISLGSIVFLYLIVRKVFGVGTALLSALFFAILPYNIYFSRVVLPEPTLVFFSLGMFYFVERWIWENKRWLFWMSFIFTSCAFLIKPVAIFYLLPLLYTFYLKEGKFWPIPRRYFVWFILSMGPLTFWRLRMTEHPEGIPASNWLLNGNGIRLRPAWWKWIIGDRFGREILTVTGSFLFFLGSIKKIAQGQNWLLHLFLLSSLLYLVVFATGNVQHDYYQTFIIPALVIFLARGVMLLLQGMNGFLPRIWTIPLAILFCVLTIYFGWGEVKGLYQINNPSIVTAGRA